MTNFKIFPRIPIGFSELTDDQIDNPTKVLQDFFNHCHLDKAQVLLWTMMRHATSPTNIHLDREKDGEHILDIYSRLAVLLQAAYILSLTKLPAPAPQEGKEYQLSVC